MSTRRNGIMERFFNSLIGGQRDEARAVVDAAIEADCPAEQIISNLFWPVLDQIQHLHRQDQLSDLAYHYATRLLRQLVGQMQMRLETGEPREVKVLVVAGHNEAEELAAQMASDLLEADGYQVYYAGGGIANDEIVAEIGNLKIDKLVVFGAVAATVPETRLLIDRLHDIGVCPQVQIIVGGGIFNRADGLAEEIGADLWAKDPSELLEVMNAQPQRRMTADQRTVGRRRRTTAASKAA